MTVNSLLEMREIFALIVTSSKIDVHRCVCVLDRVPSAGGEGGSEAHWVGPE